MTAAAQIAVKETQPALRSNAFSALMLELAKALKLVAPISMSADAQMVWLQAASDALEGISAAEVAAVSAELRRSVTRPSQIVPEIARLVSQHRKNAVSIGSSDEINAERIRLGLGAVHWVKRDGQMVLEEDEPSIKPRRHVSDRDRRTFKAEDWAELNQWLEQQGATARYRPDGSRYVVEAE